MLEYKGKYNYANVMIDVIEPELVQKLYLMLNHPAFKGGYIAIMPDCHEGKGSCIGFTKQMNEYVIPNVIGVDIGCGIEAYNLGQLKLDDRDFGGFYNFIQNKVPSGFDVRSKAIYFDSIGNKLMPKVEAICKKIELDFGRVEKAVGTLGGGNHFIELDIAPNGDVWLTIHTGSRNFGKMVCEYHQDKAKKLMNDMFIGDAYKNLEFLPMGHGAEDYIEDMKVAQEYAALNRYEIATVLMEFFKVTDCGKIKTVHNYINFEDNIIRKGAISAQEGERVLIPLNMRDGVIVGTGKGSSKWNYSAPHGAGRVLSRGKAKASLSVEKMKEDMKGIWSKSISKDTLDEAPDVYKDSQLIIDSIGESVQIDFMIKPIFNFKAGGED
jgi:tRNA-splicing ligase RtcB (3'-phosphate/5'-hydroxy nucleic acid ligase)